MTKIKKGYSEQPSNDKLYNLDKMDKFHEMQDIKTDSRRDNLKI